MGSQKETELEVSRQVQVITILEVTAYLEHQFPPRPGYGRPDVMFKRSLAECGFQAEWVPSLGVLIMKSVAKGTDLGRLRDILDLQTDTGRFRVPEDETKYVTITEHSEAVLVAADAWRAWLAKVNTALDSHLEEIVVQEVMNA